MQANAKVERVSTKKLDEVISSQKNFLHKFGLGYTRGSSSSVKVTKEVKFVKVTEPTVDASTPEKVKDEKKGNVADQRVLNMPRNQSTIRSKSRAKSHPRSQRYPRTHHVCHYCELQGHTQLNYHKLRALNNASNPRSRGPRNHKRSRGGEQSRSQDGDP